MSNPSLPELKPVQTSPFVSRDSMFNNAKLYVDDGSNQFFSFTKNISFPESQTDSFHVVQAGEVNRLDIISNNFYQTPNLWWVIAVANNIVNPFSDVYVGKPLRIPDIAIVRASTAVQS